MSDFDQPPIEAGIEAAQPVESTSDHVTIVDAWGVFDILGASAQIVCLFILFVAVVQPWFKSREQEFTLLGLAFQNVLFVLVSLSWVRRRLQRRSGVAAPSAWECLGLRADGWTRQFLAGAGFGFIIFLLAVTVVIQTVVALELLGLSTEIETLRSYSSRDEIEKLLGPRGAHVIMSTLLVVAVAPFGEEVFFRGFFYRGLKTHMPSWIAAVLSSLIFAMIHGSPLEAVALFVLGLCLVWMYERTGSLVGPMAAHGMNNAISTVMVMVGERWGP